jgi:hypothetical protein
MSRTNGAGRACAERSSRLAPMDYPNDAVAGPKEPPTQLTSNKAVRCWSSSIEQGRKKQNRSSCTFLFIRVQVRGLLCVTNVALLYSLPAGWQAELAASLLSAGPLNESRNHLQDRHTHTKTIAHSRMRTRRGAVWRADTHRLGQIMYAPYNLFRMQPPCLALCFAPHARNR